MFSKPRLKNHKARKYQAILHIHKRRIITVAVAATLLCYCALASVIWQEGQRAFTAPETNAPPEPSGVVNTASPKSVLQKDAPAQKIPGFPIALRRYGFEPCEITRSQGRFLLAIMNYAGVEGISLRLDRVAGSRLRTVQMPQGRLLQGEVLDLPPGRYVLSEENHPYWVCNITITP